MAVSALELRPRTALALFDSAVRVCARTSGVWALTLPGGALVTWAVFSLVEAITRQHDLFWPCAIFTAAWCARGVLQGAACHFVEQQVLSSNEPTVTASLKVALKRLPSLLVTVAYLFFFNLLAGGLTLGLYAFFLGAHAVGYAVAIQGKGHPLALYGTCARALGPARAQAVWVRMLFWVQALVMLNLHIAANALILVGQKLLAMDLTYASRFCSIDNRTWVAVVSALGFALFEPLRAATSSLLLIDGRVRQEGLDLLAAVEQLAVRTRKRGTAASALAGALLAGLLLSAGPAQAQGAPDDDWSGIYNPESAEPPPAPAGPLTAVQIRERLAQVAQECGESSPVLDRQLAAAGELPPTEQGALGRYLAEVETLAYDDHDCPAAKSRLRRGLALVVQARDAQQQLDVAPDARERARAILARPEFQPDPDRVEKPKDKPADKPPPEESGWWASFKRWLSKAVDDFFEWLRELLRPRRSAPELRPAPVLVGGQGMANAVVIVLVVAVAGFLAWLLLRGWRRRAESEEQAEITSSALAETGVDPMSALARPPEGWAQLADELAAKGQFREAVRHLYLALLSRLHRDGAIDYDPTKSNWDYLRGFKGRREWRSPFRELTRRFDFAWYGNVGVGPDAYSVFRGLSRPLLAQASETDRA